MKALSSCSMICPKAQVPADTARVDKSRDKLIGMRGKHGSPMFTDSRAALEASPGHLTSGPQSGPSFVALQRVR